VARAARVLRSLTLGLLLLGGCAPAKLPHSLPHRLLGEAPELPGERGSTRELPSDPRVTVVDFWASWCASCRTSLPALEALHRDHAQDGVRVVGVALDEDPEQAHALLRELGTSFGGVDDPTQWLADRWSVRKIPLTFVLDRSGVVRWVGRDMDAMERAVDALLAMDEAAR
jgi:cytochrome c biogenesis protein CcmG/thiol:disulfide interchange protein DsbE